MHGDNTLGNQIAHQRGLIRVARRQTNDFGMRWIRLETAFGLKRIMDNTQRIELFGYHTQDCIDIEFREPSVWPYAKAEQAPHFVQPMLFLSHKSLKPVDRQAGFVRPGRTQTEIRTVRDPVLQDHARLDVTDVSDS